jgi:hypothetical protein
MDKKLNISNLLNIYRESINRNEPTLAFELVNGRGRFLFLMFFDNEDKSTKDNLFVFMKNTQRMVCLKMYGNHNAGQFWVYKNNQLIEWFKQELLLNNNDSENPFDFNSFFENLNSSIPTQLSLESKINTLRNDWNQIKDEIPSDIIDDSLKIYLIGTKRLAQNKKPREKTLRKLYLHTEAKPSDVKTLIDSLKRLNMTLAWSTEKEKSIKDISHIINSTK